jgi:CubicO group peptidase (beta-lactamase class C family)
MQQCVRVLAAVALFVPALLGPTLLAGRAALASPPAASALPAKAPASPPLTWESLDARIDAEFAKGFEGVILVEREGREVVRKASGLANRERKIPITVDTIFAIGSTPIDFTKAGIIRLVQSGKVRLDAPISTYLPNVPEDKRGITIEYLLTGRSGLPDFVDQPGDRDPDHAWIDRAEFLRRVFASTLGFAPGSSREHSHAAFGVLAAVIEIASGSSYADFVTRELFTPAGMRDSGFFGQPIPEARLAIGYGMRSDGTTNAPPFWGPTSWLVMGSGGMTSTLPDLRRWFAAIRKPEFLDQSHASRFLPRGQLLTGGDMYGFEILMAESPSEPASLMLLVTNASSSRDRRMAFASFGEAVAGLVLGRPGTPPPFTLGVMLRVEDDIVIADEVVPRGAAAEAGLEAGDRLLTVNGMPFGPEPMRVLSKVLGDGKPVTLEVERRGERKTITVTPKPRS